MGWHNCTWLIHRLASSTYESHGLITFTDRRSQNAHTRYNWIAVTWHGVDVLSHKHEQDEIQRPFCVTARREARMRSLNALWGPEWNRLVCGGDLAVYGNTDGTWRLLSPRRPITSHMTFREDSWLMTLISSRSIWRPLSFCSENSWGRLFFVPIYV